MAGLLNAKNGWSFICLGNSLLPSQGVVVASLSSSIRSAVMVVIQSVLTSIHATWFALALDLSQSLELNFCKVLFRNGSFFFRKTWRMVRETPGPTARHVFQTVPSARVENWATRAISSGDRWAPPPDTNAVASSLTSLAFFLGGCSFDMLQRNTMPGRPALRRVFVVEPNEERGTRRHTGPGFQLVNVSSGPAVLTQRLSKMATLQSCHTRRARKQVNLG